MFFFLKNHGLVDRAFAIEFGYELGPTWVLVDNEGHKHIVKYNMDLCVPEIIGGWSQFLEFYGLRGNHFVYVGNNSFKITLFKGRSSSSTVNKFYDRIESRCPLIDGPYLHFTIALSVSIKPSGNFLITVFIHMLLGF